MLWKPSVTVAAIVERDGRFLLVEEDDDGERVLNQPAGHWEDGETLAVAVARETLEETAHHVEPLFLVGVYAWRHPHKPLTYLRFAYAARVVSHESGRRLDDGILQATWLTLDELRARRASHRSPLVLRCIEDYLAGRRFPMDLIVETQG